MAWKTPAGKKTAQQTPKRNGDTSFPGLKAPGPNQANTKYREMQDDEVMVLESIYGDDFKLHEATHSAWKVRWDLYQQ